MKPVPIVLAVLWPVMAFAQEKRPEMSLETRLVARVPKDHVASGIAFSPDGRKVAYLAKLLEDTEESLYVGGAKQALRPRGHPVWSPDSSRLACPAADGEKAVMTVDGEKRGAAWDDVEHPVFSPDGAKLACRALKGDKHFMVVGDAKGEAFDEIGLPVWSPDSKRLAYWARAGDESCVVVDGRKSEPYLGVVPMGDVNVLGGPVFSADGRLAYIAAKLVNDVPVYGIYVEGRKLFEARGEQKEPYEEAAGPVFGRSGEEVVWVAGGGAGKFIFVNGRKVDPKRPLASLPAVSRDGRIAFKTNRSDGDNLRCSVVEDGKAGPEFGFMHPDPPIWSPDGKRIAYAAGAPTVSPWVVVVGEKRSEEFAEVQIGGFSPDGRKFAFGAQKDFELWWRVIE